MSDGVIGSVGVAVVPDARAFWERFRAQTEGGAAQAGRRAGEDWRRGFDEATRGAGPSGRGAPSTPGSSSASSSSSRDGGGGGALGGLISAAITLAPALVPLGAAAAAAGAEFAVLGATAALAVKGIQAEMASGTPTGAAYSTLLKGLKADLSGLEATAAKGVLGGFGETVTKLRGELPQLNNIIAEQSQLLGSATSHLAGGLIGGFQTFAPLLTQVGTSVDHIAAHFEAWANGPGGAKFSSVLSSDYAKVAPIIDDLAHSIAHIVAASNGVGLGIIGDLGLLARVLDSFPTPVLTAMVAGFVAFRTVGAVKPIIDGISTGFATLGARSAASALAVNASNLQIAASTADADAAVAASRAATADAVAASQARIAESLAGTGSIMEEEAAVAAQASAEEAAAFRIAATAAAESAAEIGTAAAAAAAESEAAGAAASIGWSAMLGPIGIGVAALGFLGLGFLDSGKDAAIAAQNIQALTQAIESDSGAIGAHTRATVVDTLQTQGVLAAARQLHISLSDVTDAALGNGNAYDTLRAKLDALQAPLKNQYNNGRTANTQLRERYDLIQKVKDAIGGENNAVQDAVQAEKDHAAALVATNQTETAAAGAVLAMNQQLSDGNTAVRGYVDALDAFNKSTDTAADRGKLIGSVLVAANGDALAYVASMTAAAGAGHALSDAFTSDRQRAQDLRLQIAQLTGTTSAGATNTAHLTKLQQELSKAYADSEIAAINLNKGTIDYAKGGAPALVGQLQAIQTASMNAAAATYQHELRTKGGKKAADDAFLVYKNETQGSLIDQASKLGLTAGQAKKLADQYFGIKNSGDIKKQIELIGQDKVADALKGILQDLDILIGKTTVLDLAIANANAHASRNIGSSGNVLHQASGGYISGAGSATSDSIPARLSNGEFVVNAAQTARHRALLESVNAGSPGYAAGGHVTSGAATTTSLAPRMPDQTFVIQGITDPEAFAQAVARRTAAWVA